MYVYVAYFGYVCSSCESMKVVSQLLVKIWFREKNFLVKIYLTRSIPFTFFSTFFKGFGKDPAKNPLKNPLKNPAKNPLKNPAKNPLRNPAMKKMLLFSA